jgi:hypothetical protein
LQDYTGAYGATDNGANAYMKRTEYWDGVYKTLYPER